MARRNEVVSTLILSPILSHQSMEISVDTDYRITRKLQIFFVNKTVGLHECRSRRKVCNKSQLLCQCCFTHDYRQHAHEQTLIARNRRHFHTASVMCLCPQLFLIKWISFPSTQSASRTTIYIIII